MGCKTKVLAVMILVIGSSPHASLSESASDEQMASEAMAPYVPKDSVERDRLLRNQYRTTVELATQTPNDVQPATVFFSAGLSYREMHDLREDFGFDVIDVVMKAPQGDRGVIMSIGGGMANLFAIKGTFEERLAFMITSEQKCFAKMARYMPDDESQGMADLATNPFFVSSARIFGPNRVLGELQQQPNVRGVVLNLGPSTFSDFEQAKSYTGPHYYLLPGFRC